MGFSHQNSISTPCPQQPHRYSHKKGRVFQQTWFYFLLKRFSWLRISLPLTLAFLWFINVTLSPWGLESLSAHGLGLSRDSPPSARHWSLRHEELPKSSCLTLYLIFGVKWLLICRVYSRLKISKKAQNIPISDGLAPFLVICSRKII